MAGLKPGPFNFRAARVTDRAEGYLKGSRLLRQTLLVYGRRRGFPCGDGWFKLAASGEHVLRLADGRSVRRLPKGDQGVEALAARFTEAWWSR